VLSEQVGEVTSEGEACSASAEIEGGELKGVARLAAGHMSAGELKRFKRERLAWMCEREFTERGERRMLRVTERIKCSL
jgi:hypothetical protein